MALSILLLWGALLSIPHFQLHRQLSEKKKKKKLKSMIKQLQKAGYKSPSHLYWMEESHRRLPVFIPLFFPNVVLIWAEKKKSTVSGGS